MAQKVQVLLVDDLDGGEAQETVTFALDGKVYEIDLNAENAQRMRNFIEPYRLNARRAGTGNLRGAGVRPSSRTRYQPVADNSADVRRWARHYGIPVTQRGRVPANIREAYEAAERGEDKLLKELLSVNNLDPSTVPAPEETISNEPETPKALTAEDRARIAAKQVRSLSRAQLSRLREAYADDKGLGVSDGRSDTTSYEALRNRGLMNPVEDNVYEITLAGRLWFEVHGISPTA